MSEVLEVVEPGNGHGLCPKLRIRCAGCTRVYETYTDRWNAERLRHCKVCFQPKGPKAPIVRPPPVSIETLIERLDQADLLETATRVARDHGVTVPEMLIRQPPRHAHAAAVVSLYVELHELGYGAPRIAELTGRSRASVSHGVRYRKDRDYVDRELLRRVVRTVVGPRETLSLATRALAARAAKASPASDEAAQ